MNLTITLNLDHFRDGDGYLSVEQMTDALTAVTSHAATAEARIHEAGSRNQGLIPDMEGDVAGRWELKPQ